jgi:hypothetical protein
VFVDWGLPTQFVEQCLVYKESNQHSGAKTGWELPTSQLWQVQDNTVTFAHQNILTDVLELKIAFQKLDCRILIGTFENHSARLINVVDELLLFCRSSIRDTCRRIKLKAVGHVYTRFHVNLTALYSADLIDTFYQVRKYTHSLKTFLLSLNLN